jgi:hypothetical protein
VTQSPPRIAELLALYRRTHYDVALPGGGSATLRAGEPPPPAVATWIGGDAQAVYLTACNPRSCALTADENEARMADLRLRLYAAGMRWLEGSAAIPGQPWRESSVLAAGLPLQRIDALARAFGQNASLHVYAGAPARLRLHRSDWRGLVPADDALESDDD